MVDEPRIVGYLPVKPGIWMFYEGMMPNFAMN